MSKRFLMVLVMLLLTACSRSSAVGGEDGMGSFELPAACFKHWVHSHEEDTEAVSVYHPSDYNFPPSRGRRGFEFREGGEFIYYGIAPTDGSQRSIGRWTVEGPSQVRIELANERINPFTLEIVSCTSETLKVRR
jgi:hypothetical protein